MANKIGKKWYRVEYYTTVKPPKSMVDAEERFFPREMTKKDRIDEFKVFKVDDLKVSTPPKDKEE